MISLKIEKNVLLKNFSTFKLGGPAKYFCVVKEADELSKAIEFAKEKNLRFFILGGGSNVLFADAGFDGLVIRMENNKIEISEEENSVKCQAGARLSDLVAFFLEKNLSGMEWATGIPGTIGGAVRGNAGAYGGEMSEIIRFVNCFNNHKLEFNNFKKEECFFEYRKSIFKERKDLVIFSVILNFKKEEKNKIKKKIEDIMMKRKKTVPNSPSAGSVFQNPQVNEQLIEQFEKDCGIKCRGDKVPAGWLIEQCGMKGMKIGGAKVSEKHANFIINCGNAKAEDVVILISLIKQKARNLFGVQMREEIEIVL